MRITGLILTLLLLIIGIAFAALNSNTVVVNYLIGTTETPLALVLLVSLILGIIISVFCMGITIIRLKTRNKRLENKLKHAQTEITHAAID